MSGEKGGRPSKLDIKTQSILVDAIRQGNYFDTACRFANIEYRTFRNWMRKGEEAKSGKYFQFFHAIKKAESEAEMRLVQIWQRQLPEDWRAVATFLERRYPDKWGKKDKLKAELEHSGEVVKREEHFIEQRIQTDEEYRDLLKQLWEREKTIQDFSKE